MTMKTEILFARYKDTPVKRKKQFQTKLKEFAEEVDLGELWVRITNYQIDKYGMPLENRVKKYMHREKMLNNRRASQRRHQRREHNW